MSHSGDIGVSLLTREASARDHAAIDAAVVVVVCGNQKGYNWAQAEQANFDQDSEAWLFRAQFMANGRAIAAAARAARGNENVTAQEVCQ